MDKFFNIKTLANYLEEMNLVKEQISALIKKRSKEQTLKIF